MAAPINGNTFDSEGAARNIADLLGIDGVDPVGEVPAGVKYQLLNGNIVGSDGSVYNLADLIAARNAVLASKVDAADYNPVAKTDAMTQAVGKDGTGKLWTAPGGGGGGDIFVVIADETTFDEVKAAYDAEKTLILREDSEDGTHIWAQLGSVVFDGCGAPFRFEFISTAYLPGVLRYNVNSDGWAINYSEVGEYFVWYNETSFEEAMDAWNIGATLVLKEDEDDESILKYGSHFARLTSYFDDYWNDIAYFEFTNIENVDGTIITTQYRLNDNDEYTKTVTTDGSRLVLDEDDRLEDGHDISKYIKAVRKFVRSDSHGDERTFYAPFTGIINAYDSEGVYAEAVLFELTFEDPLEHHTAHITFYLREDSFDWEHVYLQETFI